MRIHRLNCSDSIFHRKRQEKAGGKKRPLYKEVANYTVEHSAILSRSYYG